MPRKGSARHKMSSTTCKVLRREIIKTLRWSTFSLFLLSLIFLATSASQASEPPKTTTSSTVPISTFEAHYIARAKGMPFKGKAIRKLKFENGVYKFSMKAKSLFTSITEHAEFNWNNVQQCALRPTRYDYQRKGLSKDRHRSIRFNWEKRKAVYQDKKRESVFSWQGELNDKLTEHLVVRCHLMAGERKFTIQIADRDVIKEHEFIVTAEEIIETGIGKVNTLKLERTRQIDDRRSTIFWLAPELDYLLVKLEQVKRERNNLDKIEQSFVITLKKLK